MAQVQAQQQDNGEGVLIEYHLRKLRELVRLEEPDASIPDGAASTSSSPAMGASGGEGQASPGVDHSVSDLEASFEKQRLTDYQSDSKVLPANPMRGTECSEEGSPMHPSTPDQQIQAQPQMV